uniref:Uncharacterized protein n=1 Tax=Arundo donax TaxID=35708 RepID=A0A0A9RLZ2_ARUDO
MSGKLRITLRRSDSCNPTADLRNSAVGRSRLSTLYPMMYGSFVRILPIMPSLSIPRPTRKSTVCEYLASML